MRKILVIVVAILVLGSSTVFGARFSDTTGHWAEKVVDEMATKGILNGFEDGTFKPNISVTREQFAKILVESLKIEEKNSNINFQDVEDGRWSKDYIERASKYLTIGKTNDGRRYFMPTEDAVREEVATAVVKASGPENEIPNYDLLKNFSDEDKISNEFRKYIAIAVEHGIMQGKGGLFDPQGGLTRAEASQLIYNVYTKIAINEEPTIVESAQFAAFSNEMGELQDTVYSSFIKAIGEEALNGNNRTKQQVYNYIARGGEKVITTDAEGAKKWLTQKDAENIACTKINEKYAEDILEMKLPVRKVNTYKGEQEQVSYFVTPKGRVFCYPPYEFRGKSYVTPDVTIKDSNENEISNGQATRDKEVKIYFEETKETVIISNASNGKPTVYVRDNENANGIGVWYTKSGSILGIDFSKYDNTELNIKTENIEIEKKKIEWLEIKNDEEVEISLNGKNKKIKLNIYNLTVSAETGECKGVASFTNVDNQKENVTVEFSKYRAEWNSDSFAYSTNSVKTINNIEFHIGKMIDIKTNEEYLIFAFGHGIDDKLIICDNNMKICAKFERPDGYMFAVTAVFEEGETISYPIDEKYIVPVEECFNTEIIYYDLFGMEKEYGQNVYFAHGSYEKSEGEHKMAKRKITIENGAFYDRVLETYTNFAMGQV